MQINIVKRSEILKKSIQFQDLLGATCATPPYLEGASLFQVPVDSLNCDDNSEVLEQLDIISKQSNLPYSKDLSEVVSTTLG